MNGPRTIIVFAVAALLAASCSVSRDGASPVASSTMAAFTSFTITTAAGSEIKVNGAGDCAALSDPWLEAWCRDLVTYRPGVLPTKLETSQHIEQALIQSIEAGLAWALLHGDNGICDNSVVAGFVSSSPGGAPGPSPSPSRSPSQRCRQGLDALRAESQSHGGAFSMLSPDTLIEVRVGLLGGQPLPTPRAS